MPRLPDVVLGPRRLATQVSPEHHLRPVDTSGNDPSHRLRSRANVVERQHLTSQARPAHQIGAHVEVDARARRHPGVTVCGFASLSQNSS